MIHKLSKLVLIFGLGLFLAGAVLVTGSGITWGINGVVLTVGIGVVVLAVGAFTLIWIAGAVEGLLIRFLLVWQSMRRINAETAKQEMAADFYQVNHPVAGAIAVDRAGNMIRLQPPVGQPGPGKTDQPRDPEPADDGPEIVGPLLPVLEGMNRILLIGGMGCGKSELLKWLADDRVKKGHVVVCDSHAAPDTWPTYCQISGIGRNYPEIEATINWICAELDNRYKQRAAGEKKHFDQITLIVDELFVLHQFLNLGAQFKSLLAESRKVNVALIMAGQSDRANALGLSGNKDLIAGFEAVVYLDRDDHGRYVAEVKSGKRTRLCLHPGPYRGGRGGSPGGPGGPSGPGPSSPSWGGPSPTPGSYTYSSTPGKNAHTRAKWPFSGGCNGVGCKGVGYEPGAEPYVYEARGRHIFEASDGKTAAVIRMYRSGATITEICKNVLGAKGGHQSKKVKKILSAHGLI